VTVAVLAQSRLFGLMPVNVAFRCVINGLFTLVKFVAKQMAILCHCLTSLGHLGRHIIDRIVHGQTLANRTNPGLSFQL
jgi:hypothetical protein